ncbi:hypothetical protein [Bdellovibrio svalbardensis]|uniref:Uncharacterized protein n=1 Tax=Bdellovibrio svalbardensis TaxID=2972972 RepID=A0ABT6DG29_9BACT|nr:hypothetical protein [Bdellovibrio svalbardensis]MDG0815800.1 hypothetical protein [Bdellovibrio svalbardensis]
MKISLISYVTVMLSLFATNVASAASTSCSRGISVVAPEFARINDRGSLEILNIPSSVRCLSDSLSNHKVSVTVFVSNGSSVVQRNAEVLVRQINDTGGSVYNSLDAVVDIADIAGSGKVWFNISIDGRVYEYVSQSRAAAFDFSKLGVVIDFNGWLVRVQYLVFGSSKTATRR